MQYFINVFGRFAFSPGPEPLPTGDAMATSPGIIHAMAEIAQCRISGLPAVLSQGLRENSSSPHRITMQHGWKYNHLDAVLISSMESVAGIGFIQEENVFFKQIQEQEGGIDLLNPPWYLWDPVERIFTEVMDFKDLDSRVFYRAAWPETSFAIPGKPSGDVNIRITHRLPVIPGYKGSRQGYLTVKINGSNVAAVTTGENWNVGEITIPAAFFNLSLNKLTLCWPPLPPCGDAALENIKNKLERGHQTDVHPVFGEVFSIRLFHVNWRRSG